jgi:capsular exopolysaccharide synthesis family protein
MTAVALAQAMAESGSRVLLVDSDMRRPRLHEIFECDNSRGLSSLVLDESHFEEACRPTGIANLTLVPCGPLPPNPAELLHTESFGRLLKRMAETYDRVVFDSPPVGVVSDALVLSTIVDGTVLVLKAGGTSRDLARRVVRSLAGVNARVFGAILNEIDVARARYGYTYLQYGYGQADKPGPASQA